MLRRVPVAAIAAALAVVGLHSQSLPQDRGAAGTWQKLLKLRTIASAMHTTAHPDDEDGGMLALVSRGEGARLSLLTLTRGEAGDNAIGSELFDALGMVRTEELLAADRYYGVDDQYFTSVVDYGFSKRLEEAFQKWGRENVLRDVVRVIRMDRPLVLISRFQGNERDGHPNHQTAGIVTQDAFEAAGDPARFPEQIAEGLRPWRPLKLYIGGVRENEDWTIRIDSGQYSPWLGDSFKNFALIGLALQRSQNAGAVTRRPGSSFTYYKRVASLGDAPAKETSFFDGIDTAMNGIFAAIARPAPPGATDLLGAIQQAAAAAVRTFNPNEPWSCVPSLVSGLKATRTAMKQLAGEPDALAMLSVKESQFTDAINAAMGIEFSAIAEPEGTKEPSGPFAAFAPAATMGPVVPGQPFQIRYSLTNRSAAVTADTLGLGLTDPSGAHQGSVRSGGVEGNTPPLGIARDRAWSEVVQARAPDDRLSQPYFRRTSLAENRYVFSISPDRYRAANRPAWEASVRYWIGDVAVPVTAPVQSREAQLPYGYVLRELMIVPALSVTVSPTHAVVPLHTSRPLRLRVNVINNDAHGGSGNLALRLPAGWEATPSAATLTFARAGERASVDFDVAPSALEDRDYSIQAEATVSGRVYRSGYDLIQHRDLETRYLYRDAATQVRGLDVRMPAGLKVGYVMGVGDDIPAAIAQLGADVQLLELDDLASGDLGRFATIVTGTRAYGVREDLRTYNGRLLEFVNAGGHLLVLYNTPSEFDPAKFAPYPAVLPEDAEEVVEEDSPVDVLAPSDPVWHTPNEITSADFRHWIEQRGSKFFSTWDPAYTSMMSTHDTAQPPQGGGWVTAQYGRGHYTYFAYALHRQLPYGVPGAYRLLANLLAMGKSVN